MIDQNGAPFGANQGYVYNGYAAAPAPKVRNVLSDEEIKELQQERSQFSLGITSREAKQAACNHRTADGTRDSLVYDQETGKARCTICGYEFRPIEPDTSYESIVDATDRLIDIVQTIKMMYTDLPANAAREYFQIIPMIKKIPQLFEFAAKNFAKHEYDAWGLKNYNMGGMALLNNLSSMFGASQYAAPQPGYYAAPQGYAAPQPGYYAPQGVPMTPPQAPVGNPFGYPGASEVQQGYQPQSAGFAYNPAATTPGAVPPAPQPTAPVAPAETAPAAETVTQKVTV